MLRRKISKILKEDGKEYIVTTTFSGDTIIRTKEFEIVPREFVDYFPLPENMVIGPLKTKPIEEDRIIDRFDGYFENEKAEMEEAIKTCTLQDEVDIEKINTPLIKARSFIYNKKDGKNRKEVLNKKFYKEEDFFSEISDYDSDKKS